MFVYAGDKIDCTNQLCDLEWLIKSKPGLLGTTVQNGACSDGTKFEDVDLCLFSSCKVIFNLNYLKYIHLNKLIIMQLNSLYRLVLVIHSLT